MKCKIIKNHDGMSEIDFGLETSLQDFYRLARKLEHILVIHYYKKQNDYNTIIWSYKYQGMAFKLYHHWETGLRISAITEKKDVRDETILTSMADTILPFC